MIILTIGAKEFKPNLFGFIIVLNFINIALTDFIVVDMCYGDHFHREKIIKHFIFCFLKKNHKMNLYISQKINEKVLIMKLIKTPTK